SLVPPAPIVPIAMLGPVVPPGIVRLPGPVIPAVRLGRVPPCQRGSGRGREALFRRRPARHLGRSQLDRQVSQGILAGGVGHRVLRRMPGRSGPGGKRRPAERDEGLCISPSEPVFFVIIFVCPGTALNCPPGKRRSCCGTAPTPGMCGTCASSRSPGGVRGAG